MAYRFSEHCNTILPACVNACWSTSTAPSSGRRPRDPSSTPAKMKLSSPRPPRSCREQVSKAVVCLGRVMKLHPTKTDPEVPSAPEDWTMTIGRDQREKAVFYYADVARNGGQVCRIAFSDSGVSEDEAHRRLAVRARLWINDYLSRPHSGESEFGTLE